MSLFSSFKQRYSTMSSLNISAVVSSCTSTCHSNSSSNDYLSKPHPVIRQKRNNTVTTCIGGNLVATPICSKHHSVSCSCDLMSSVVGSCTHKYCPNK